MFMETTEVPPERTAAEIRVELVKAGASKIMEDYQNGRVVAITFAITVQGTDLPFRLPVRPEPVYKVLRARTKKFNSWDRRSQGQDEKLRAQAERVAWRQVYRWIQAQVALIQTGMVAMQEVFFPYLTNGTQTVYEVMAAQNFKALPAPRE